MLTHITVDNVRQAYAKLPNTFGSGVPIREETRNGPTLTMPGPLVTSYRNLCQRVLTDPGRDANPFFHLMEAFWMLAGRADVASLMHYNSGMAKYSDDGEIFHGAYGHRWRHHFVHTDASTDLDQLAEIIHLLRANPADRRIVLQMWDPETDLGQVGLDFPCNNLCYFRVRQVDPSPPHAGVEFQKKPVAVLDMTIACRSNDMLWGGYGANAVHFSVLQEFVASMIGVRVGEMHQLSNNAHLYLATTPDLATILPYVGYPEVPVPLFGDLSTAPIDEVFDDLDQIWDDTLDGEVEHIPNSTLRLIAGMRLAWAGWKEKKADIFTDGIALIPHEDWKKACFEWGFRRRDKFA